MQNISNTPAVWGNIKGALSAQIDLTNALNNKLPASAFDGLAKITVGTTQPSTPSVNDLWVDTN
jgi:hypothetical protein